MSKSFNSHNYEYERLCAQKPLLSYDGVGDFSAWCDAAREKLLELLGLPLELCDPELEVEYVKAGDTYTDYRFTVQTEPGYYVPCHLLVPNGMEGKIPLGICLSGHATGMHIVLGNPKTKEDEASLIEWPHRAIAPRVVSEGRAALVIEARNFGESSLGGYGTSCTEAAKIAMLSGRTVIGERVWDTMRILDATLAHFDMIDPENIICTGNSGGGTATYYLACLEERIALAAPCSSVCNYEDSIAAMPHCLCNHVPNIRKYFEIGDLAGLIAPRKLVIGAGEIDPIFPKHGTLKAFETIKSLYTHAGVPENCVLVFGNNAHFYYPDEIFEKVHAFGF